MNTRVHLISLGCARNDVDSEELAGRLEAGGFALADDPSDADVILVNTCGFIDTAKKDSIDTILDAADLKGTGRTQAVVAVGCLAERYGRDLAESLPEADAVLGFDHYAEIGTRLRQIMAGETIASHIPSDRRTLLPVTPVARQEAASDIVIPGLAHAADRGVGMTVRSEPRVMRRRLEHGPSAPVKIASGCDRRCGFCAIPRFRGSFVSRPVDDVVAEVRWLVDQGVKEAYLVSENTSSYGKDLGEVTALERLLSELDRVDGLEWVRVSYLQPAEVRPGLIEAMLSSDKVVPYFDLSFQHASPTLLRRMRRFGDPESFLSLLEQIRTINPRAGIRSNVIVGFPGETQNDMDTLIDFVAEARLDALGVFPYSDEEGTEGRTLSDHVSDDVIAERAEMMSDLAIALVEQRAEERIGETVQVMIESVDSHDLIGRAQHQGPDVDGIVILPDTAGQHQVGDFVWGRVVASEGVDLIVQGVDSDD